MSRVIDEMRAEAFGEGTKISEVITNMLQDDISSEDIARYLDISLDEVKRVQETMKIALLVEIGRTQALEFVATNMIKAKRDNNEIAQYTGLSDEDINKIRKKIKPWGI